MRIPSIPSRPSVDLSSSDQVFIALRGAQERARIRKERARRRLLNAIVLVGVVAWSIVYLSI